MCQVQDGDDEMPKHTSSLSTTCMKCEESAVISLKSSNSAFCRECFLKYFIHKFRSTIGKSKLVKNGEKVLLAFSGGQSSSAMLKLVQEGLNEETHKKLRFHPGVVYIDEGAVTSQSLEERHSILSKVQSVFSQYGFPCHIESLETVLDLEDSEEGGQHSETSRERLSNEKTSSDLCSGLDKLIIDESQTQRLQDLLASTKSLTAKEDLLQVLRTKLLLHIARTHDYDRIMVGNSGTNLSICILADLAKGKGAAVPLDTNFADRRYGDIYFLRPMREFIHKEIAIYNRYHSIEPIIIPTLTTKVSVNASINQLTEAFVNGLQVNFPSTVSTVFRTGEKFCAGKSPSPGDTGPYKCCVLCQASLDTDVGKSSALQSTEFSLSLMKTNNVPTNQSDEGCCNDTGTECCGQGDGSCHSNPKINLTPEQMKEYLCYGCRVTLRNMKDVDKLPRYVKDEVEKSIRRSKMKAEIEDFLLDEAD
ncbi:cytoplasmic tRNA 2-thiolation protein 2-A-like [Glandiceps talaboti]